jgi:hypothetical protein
MSRCQIEESDLKGEAQKMVTQKNYDGPVSVDVVENGDKVRVSFNKVISWIEIEPVAAIKVAEQIRCAAIGILRRTSTPI